MMVRFVITDLDSQNSRGFVRQLATDSDMTSGGRIAFRTDWASDSCYDDEGGYGYRTPSAETAARQHEIGMELIGSIAATNGEPIALDADGNPFLRNWAFADQHDALVAAVDSGTYVPANTRVDDDHHMSDEDYSDDDQGYDMYATNNYDDDEEDYVSTRTVYDRALTHFGGNHELAREAASQYPGDFR